MREPLSTYTLSDIRQYLQENAQTVVVGGVVEKRGSSEPNKNGRFFEPYNIEIFAAPRRPHHPSQTQELNRWLMCFPGFESGRKAVHHQYIRTFFQKIYPPRKVGYAFGKLEYPDGIRNITVYGFPSHALANLAFMTAEGRMLAGDTKPTPRFTMSKEEVERMDEGLVPFEPMHEALSAFARLRAVSHVPQT